MATHAASYNQPGSDGERSNYDALVKGLYPLAGLLAFAALAYVSIELTRGDGRIAVVWLPNALAVALLLRRTVPHEPILLAAMFLGNILANTAVGDGIVTATSLALANLVEIWLAVTLVRSWCGRRPDMSNTRDLASFMIGAGVIAPLASAAIASLALAGPSGIALSAIVRWATSDALSMLILAPSALVLQDALANIRSPSRQEIVEWLLLTIGGTSLTFAVFYQTQYPLLFLVPPMVVAHAFRLGALGTAFSVMKVATIALIFTQAGRGPINLAHVTIDMQILVLEAFLASSMVVGLPIAAVLATRERDARELAAGKKQLALLADNITDAILRYDLDGRCTYASPSVENVLGLPSSQFVGRSSSERVHPEAEIAIRDVEEALLTGKKDKERFTYRRYLDAADGSPVYIEADCAVAFNSETGAREGIVVSAREITQRVELERKLKRATLHAENAARAKAQFLANMSHEIRTPMNGVLGFADLLARMELEPEASRYADLIVRSGRSMMILLNDILDISKIESGQLVLSYETFDIPQLVDDCARLHSASAEDKGIRLSAKCRSNVPKFMRSDPLRLRQIVLNLLGNAVKFTERGEVSLMVDYEGDELIVTVEDSGIGIAADRLQSIFDPFVQEEASTTRRYGGTGLGLSISRQLAELLGGSLDVVSEPNVGSKFMLRLPFEACEEETPELVAHNRRATDGPAPIRGRILLAEDHDVNQMLVTAMLEQLGQRVEVAHDGNEAVEAVLDAAARGQGYDLVLMDVQMPVCDGYCATRMIRASGQSASALPIVALTANAYPEDIAAALDAGMQAHLAKPLVFNDLAKTLARWMPVRIVDEKAVASAHSGEINPSASMRERWFERKGEALEAIGNALRDDRLEGVVIEDLARTVHKLAGTAGLFGEVELGEKAAAFERALRASVEIDVRRKLAQELLDLA